jgi:Tfp pilus assembly protein PilX
MMKSQLRTHDGERGAALILAMILIAVISVMAASMIALSNTESWSTANYRMASQARDGAEAAVYRAAHFLAEQPQSATFTYNTPTAVTAFESSGATYPVKVGPGPNGPNVVLVGGGTLTNPPSAAYPTGAGVQANVASNFANFVQGTLPTGENPIRFSAYAELLSIRTATGFTGDFALEQWRITGEGRIGSQGSEGATVQVSTIMDRPPQAAPATTVYATSTNCANPPGPPLDMNGGSITGSYDSSTPGCSAATFSTSCGVATSGGSVGTNGYINLGNSAIVNGSVYQVQPGGVGGGNCSPAMTGNGSITGTPQFIYQTQAPVFPNPLPPTPAPTTGAVTIQDNPSGRAACDAMAPACTRGGVMPAGQFKLAPTCSPAVPQCPAGTTFPDLTLKGATSIFHVCAGTYNVNSLALSSGSTIITHATASSDPLNICGGVYGPTIINVQGLTSPGGVAVDLTAGTLSNPSLSAVNFKILYAGTDLVKVSGGAGSAALVYAPSAAVFLEGSATFYGAIVGSTFRSTGGADINYDRSLANLLQQAGSPMLQAFTWKTF